MAPYSFSMWSFQAYYISWRWRGDEVPVFHIVDHLSLGLGCVAALVLWRGTYR